MFVQNPKLSKIQNPKLNDPTPLILGFSDVFPE
jgi:hypothetical protein